MQTISVYSAQAAQAGLKEQKIVEGSLVNVRIVSSNGEGKYVGIVAGVRVNLKSDSFLQNGEVFRAKISIKNNTIFLKPLQNNNSIENNNKIQLDNFPLKLVENEELFSFFSRLSLPADNTMITVFQMMKQLKMKFDIPLFMKIHNMSVKFGKQQKSAAEILMILQKKGIEISNDFLLDFIEFLNGDNFFNENENYFGNKNEWKKNKEENQKRIVNSMNSRKGGWFIFPFCILENQFNKEIVDLRKENSEYFTKNIFENNIIKNEKRIGEGNIRVLVNDSDRIEILNLSCFFNNARNFASLLYENGFIKELRVNFEKKLEKKEEVILYLQSKCNKLYSKGKIKNQIEVQWADEGDLTGFSSDNEKFYSINKII